MDVSQCDVTDLDIENYLTTATKFGFTCNFLIDGSTRLKMMLIFEKQNNESDACFKCIRKIGFMNKTRQYWNDWYRITHKDHDYTIKAYNFSSLSKVSNLTRTGIKDTIIYNFRREFNKIYGDDNVKIRNHIQ